MPQTPPVFPHRSSHREAVIPDVFTTNIKDERKEGADKQHVDVDGLVEDTIAMDLEGEVDNPRNYGPAPLDIVGRRPIIPSVSAPPLRFRSPIDHAGVGVHVSTKPAVTEDLLWRDPLEGEGKNKGGVLLCEVHGRACLEGTCEVYKMQLLEQEKS